MSETVMGLSCGADSHSMDGDAALKAPFPYFGGKSRIAPLVWSRFGNVVNYCEPFAGSLAMLLGRPRPFEGTETVNDADGLVSNFWRALQADPDAVAHHADWLVNENDLHARHAWLVGRKDSLQARLEGDPDYYDVKVAGWWVWGICAWIGTGWCKGKGPWQIIEAEDGSRQLVHLGDVGRGINRKLLHLGNAGQGIYRQCVHLGDAGKGINRKLVHLGNAGQGINSSFNSDSCAERSEQLVSMMRVLADRLRCVRVCCGDWSRICGPTPTLHRGLTAVFLDPPYADTAGRDDDLYRKDCLQVAHDVRGWAVEHGDDPDLRIALCGYECEHVMPDSWECVSWKTRGGYSNQRKARDAVNPARERIWFSPHCRKPAAVRQATLKFT